jgi:hypothetical protein
MLLSGCAAAELTESGRLTDYEKLVPSDGIVTKGRIYVDREAVQAARSVRLLPTTIETKADGVDLTPDQLRLVSNALDRSLCRGLSTRFVIVAQDESADLLVQAVITRLTATDVTAAGVSAVTGLGGKAVSAASGVPIPVPRIPFGLGSLTVEAEARDSSGKQMAAIVWARGADVISTDARVSEEGDAHTLAILFAEDLTKLLVTGSDPISDPTPSLPTADIVSDYFGGAPKYAACAQFGSHPGLGNTLGSKFGLPPSWTDGGPKNE